jgi:hypothetical protein
MLGCAFSFLKLNLCRQHADNPQQSNIVQHTLKYIEIGNGFRVAPKRYQWQAEKHVYVIHKRYPAALFTLDRAQA